MWSETIAARLAQQWPTTLAATLKPYGLTPTQVWATDPESGESRNRRGYLRDTVSTARLATRHQRPADGPTGGDAA